MRSVFNVKWTFFLVLSVLFLNTVCIMANDKDDEDSPEVTARVARINFINGNAQIKRVGSNDWEAASLNTPLVEGDEIATETGSAADIQFDSQNILHLAENSFLKIVTLRDEGVAVSISEGKLSLRVFAFDKDKTFFEIDAPQTTISVQHAGLYRIDIGGKDSADIRVTATEGAEARVLSADADFTLRDGKSARVTTSGDKIGDHETSDALAMADDWDKWVADRDAVLAKLIDQADYDKYYDRDIYGAEDLNSYGQWHESDDYGWVWQPFGSSIGGYDNWTPYRYGHWSWVPPYGWTWINDEPWGWAPYHYGRWIYDNNGWAWTPYPYNRPRRSWWRPAIVVIGNSGSDICWYPTPYHKRYHDFNRHDREKYLGKRGGFNNSNRNTSGNLPAWTHHRDEKRADRRNSDNLPPNSVVAVNSGRFGRRQNRDAGSSNQSAGQFLAKNPDKIKDSPKLPDYRERREDFKRPGRANDPTSVKIGAAARQPGVELNREIENRRNQERRSRDASRDSSTTQKTGNTDSQKNQQGTPERSSRRDSGTNDSAAKSNNSPEKRNENHPGRNSDSGNSSSTPRANRDNSGDNNRTDRSRNDENRKSDQNRQSGSSDRSSSPPRQEKRSDESRSEPRREQTRQEQPRQESPRRESSSPSRQESSPRRESSPSRQESPKSETKENKSTSTETKKDTKNN